VQRLNIAKRVVNRTHDKSIFAEQGKRLKSHKMEARTHHAFNHRRLTVEQRNERAERHHAGCSDEEGIAPLVLRRVLGGHPRGRVPPLRPAC
jgi:hypothetical protein